MTKPPDDTDAEFSEQDLSFLKMAAPDWRTISPAETAALLTQKADEFEKRARERGSWPQSFCIWTAAKLMKKLALRFDPAGNREHNT